MSLRSLLFLSLICLCSFESLTAQDAEKPKPPVEDWVLNRLLTALDDPKPPVEDWVLNGLLAALDDPEPGVAEFVPFLAIPMTRHFNFMAAADKKKTIYLAKQLGDLLANAPQHDVRRWAAAALGQLGEAAAAQAPALVDLLKDQDGDVRTSAVFALSQLGEAAAAQAPALGELLKQQDYAVRSSAAYALGQLGEAAAAQAAALGELLKDDVYTVRSSAANALGQLGSAAASHAPALGELLEDQYILVRSSAAHALGQLGEAAVAQAPALVELLKDQDFDVRSSAAYALGQLGEPAAAQAAALGELLKDQDFNVRSLAADAIAQVVVGTHLRQRLEPAFLLRLMRRNQRNDTSQASAICVGHLACAGHSSGQIAVSLLGKRQRVQSSEKQFNDERKVMNALLEVWQDSSTLPPECDEVRIELATVMARQTKRSEWKASLSDINYLKDVHSVLKEVQDSEKPLPLSGPIAVVSARIAELEKQNQWLTWRDRVWKTVAVHSVFWATLIFAYPRFAWVQAIFFWNPWVRRILGLGYVGVALAWVPFLRQRLFAPFDRSLLADADLEGTQRESYFPRSQVRKLTGHSRGPLLGVKEAIPALKGQVVLQGASGLGKTMFLQHMLAGTNRITVFLRADRCTQGVMPAIQAKLKGSACDEKYLAKLIHAGAIDICIDGLNEASADTRAKIIRFTEDQFSGNIILTTQPIEWTPPATATVFELQPLDADQIEDFLTSRKMTKDADVTSEKYESRCRGFLKRTIPKSKDDSLTTSARRILSNPMDLTIVSQLLARDQKPDLLRLQQQQYDSMAEDYATNQKKPFPLETFSQAVYEMRLADQSDLPADNFAAETECMSKHRMVVRREIPAMGGQSDSTVVWRFRHDKVMEFFIVQWFLQNPELQTCHFSDERFRGVYFLLANTLPRGDAKALREKLIQHAAETKNHNVSDEFVILLKDREELDASPDELAEHADSEEPSDSGDANPAN